MSPKTTPNPASLFYAGAVSLRLLRGLLALSQSLSPRFSAALAFQLFSTPIPFKWATRRSLPAPWQAQPWELMGRRLNAWRHSEAAASAERPRVLLVHGWAGEARQMLALAESLWAGGFDPILLDMPAHGHSQGWRTHMPQFQQTLHAAAQRFGPLHGIVAHSLGALAVGHAVAQGLPTERLALLACSAPPRQVLHWFGLSFGLGEGVIKRISARLTELGGVGLEAFEPAWLGQRLTLPTLLVHDRNDKAAPLAHAQALHAALPAARLHLTEGLGHRRILSDPAVLTLVSRYLS